MASNERMALKSTMPPQSLNHGMTAAELIRLLELEPHPLEGGYFRRTYESRLHCGYGGRPLLTSIY